MSRQMRAAKRGIEGTAHDRQRLETLFFEVQRRRIALTGAVMELRGGNPGRRSRIVLRILVALLRLQAANRKAMAALRIAKLV